MKAITFKVISHSLTLPSEMPAPLCQGQKSRVKSLPSAGQTSCIWAPAIQNGQESNYLHFFQRIGLLLAYQHIRCEELKLSISVFDQDLASQEELT